MRRFVLIAFVLLACATAVAQGTTSGMSPKAGAFSSNLYTNMYFGFNFQVPKDWDVAFVASEGGCDPECLMLDIRVPGYPKPPRMINISAEAAPNATPQRLPSLAQTLEQTGKKKLSPVRDVPIGGRTFYRMEYRVPLANTDVYHVFLTMPTKDYLLVFTIQAETRRQMDVMVDDVTRSLTFMNAGARENASTTTGGIK